jgi:hypothetical protein
MIITEDFFNKLASELDKKYFPDLKYYRDNEDCAKIHYAIELFNNGCLTYDKLIKKISSHSKDSCLNIHNIVSKYIKDFEGYNYKII